MKKMVINKGITLIALIITIVILIILTGITIATLAGEDGILTKVQSAKLKNEKANLEEQIKLAILDSRVNYNNQQIDLKILEEELKNRFGLTDDEIEKTKDENNKEKLPWKIIKNGLIFIITENGEVEEVNGITLSSTEIKLLPGESKTITASLTKGVTGTIKWTSNNEKIVVSGNDTSATVTANGENAETAIIIAEIPGTSYSTKCKAMIVSKVTAISSENFQIETNKEKIIEIKTTPSEGVETLTYEYKANNSNVEVDNNGKVKGITPGKTVVTIKGTGNSGTNVSTTCTITVIKAIEPKTGDFVNYSAGTWKQEDLDKLGEYYAGADLPTESEAYKFGGFTLGQSKDKTITPYPNYTPKQSGWRILSQNDDGTYNLIHAGTPEGYYHPYGKYNAYKSQYIFGAGINTNNEDKWDYETIKVRDWSMYENLTYAKEGSARSVTYDEMVANAGLRNIGTRYWLSLACPSYDAVFLYEVHQPGGISSSGNECAGIRPVVTLKSNIKLIAKEGDTQHNLEETAWQMVIE